MKWWIRDTSSGKTDASSASVSQAAGVPVPPVDPLEGNRWTPLAVSKHYKAAFAEFLSHYERELEALADAEGGEESEDHQHLAEHTQKLLGLINNVSAEEIDECMHAVLTDEEVESGSVDSQELRKRVEAALGNGAPGRGAHPLPEPDRLRDRLIIHPPERNHDAWLRIATPVHR